VSEVVNFDVKRKTSSLLRSGFEEFGNLEKSVLSLNESWQANEEYLNV
jgi:hypothetical protein